MKNLGEMQNLKLSGMGLILGTALLAGCASVPTEPVSEKLDPDTAVTVTVLSQPIELFSQANRGKQMDPFAYIAPFETNKMGARDLFLWVSTPQAQGQLTQPEVMCDGQPLALEPLSSAGGAAAGAAAGTGANVTLAASGGTPVKVDLSSLNLSRAPYNAPVPWGTQWYFRLPAESLKCLAETDGLKLKARAADGTEQEFEPEGKKKLAGLGEFERR